MPCRRRASAHGNGEELSAEPHRGAVNQRSTREHGSVVGQELAGEVVRAVDEDVVCGDELARIRGVESDGVGLDGELRIKPRQRAREGGHLQLADVGVTEQHLPVKVGGVDAIVVDHAETRGARRCQRQRRRAAEAARTEDESGAGHSKLASDEK